MPRHKFPTIKDKGGLKIHLDSQKSLHRGFGYKTYRILRLAGVNKTNRARAFNVTLDTIRNWDEEDNREQGERQAHQDAEVDKLKD